MMLECDEFHRRSASLLLRHFNTPCESDQCLAECPKAMARHVLDIEVCHETMHAIVMYALYGTILVPQKFCKDVG
eukprot:1505785-Amphidinium_carterae.1